MKPKTMKNFLFVLVVLTFSSCHIYRSQPTPLVNVEDKGDLDLSAGYAFPIEDLGPGIQLAATYAITDTVSIQGYFAAEGTPNFHLELSMAYQFHDGINDRADISGGIFRGYFDFENHDIPLNAFNEYLTLSGNYNAIYTRPQYVFENRWVYLGGAVKLGYFFYDYDHILSSVPRGHTNYGELAIIDQEQYGDAFMVEPAVELSFKLLSKLNIPFFSKHTRTYWNISYTQMYGSGMPNYLYHQNFVLGFRTSLIF